MSKGRRLLIGLLIVAGVLIVGGAVLKALFPADRLAAMAAERIKAESGADMTYGKVSLDLWPRVGLSIEGLTLALDGDDLAAATGEPAGPLVSLSTAVMKTTAGLAWVPLLKRRVELDRLILDEPMVIVSTRVVEADGGGPASAPAEASPVAVILAGISVRDGSIRWTEEGTGRRVAVEHWNQDADLDDVALLGRRLTAFAAGTPLMNDGVAASEVGLEGRIGHLELTGFQPDAILSLADIGFAAEGRIESEAEVFELPSLTASWAGTRVEGHGNVRGEGDGFRLELQWVLAELDAPALQKAVPGLAPTLPEPWGAWLAEAPVNVEGFEASGTYGAHLPPAPDATPVDHLRGLDAVASLASATFTPPDMATPWVAAATARIDGGELTVSDTRVEIGDGHLTGRMTMAPLGAPDAAVHLDAVMNDLPTRVVLETIAPSAAPYLEGGLDGKVVGGFRLGEPEAIRSSLTLDGEGILQEGVVHASSWLDGISRYLGDRQDLKEIRYHSLSHLLKVRDGKYVIDDLVLVGHDTDWSGDGWIGLDGAIDLGLNVKFPRDFRPDLGSMSMFAEALRGEDGRLALDLTLTGRAARPAVSLDLTAANDRMQDAVSGGVQGWLDKLRRKD